MRKNYIFLFLISVITASLFSQTNTNNIDGHWEGSINLSGSKIGFKADFKTGADSTTGTMDVPLQKAEGLKLIHVKANNEKVYFELPAGPGLAIFDGKLTGD